MINSCNCLFYSTNHPTYIHWNTHSLCAARCLDTFWARAPADLRVPSLQRSLWNLLIFPLSLRPALPRARHAHITSFADRTVHLHPVMSQRLRVLNIRIDYSLLCLLLTFHCESETLHNINCKKIYFLVLLIVFSSQNGKLKQGDSIRTPLPPLMRQVSLVNMLNCYDYNYKKHLQC